MTNKKLLRSKLFTFFGVIFFQVFILFVSDPKPGRELILYGIFIFMDLLLLTYVFVGNKKLEYPKEDDSH